MGDMQEAVRWEISVPIFKNSIIMEQLAVAVGIPFGLVALVIVLASGMSRDTLYALGLIAAVLVLTWLFIMAAFRGKYEAEFTLDNKGALCRTGVKQASKNRTINNLTVLLGLLTGRPAVAGAGLLAQTGQEVFIRWNRITKVEYNSKRHTILLRGGWTEQIALFCTNENYEQMRAFVHRSIPLAKRGTNR